MIILFCSLLYYGIYVSYSRITIIDNNDINIDDVNNININNVIDNVMNNIW